MNLLMGAYLRRNYHGRYYAKAQNVRHLLTRAYDAALERHDLLIMPTAPFRAPPLPPPDCSIEESVAAAANMASNTCQANLTGHPSMSVPYGMADGLPIGMMITGRHLDDSSVIAAPAACESLGDWRTMRGRSRSPAVRRATSPATHDLARHREPRARALALAASTSRSCGGLFVESESISRRATTATSSTASSKAAALTFEGRVKPLSLRTNCSDAARTSSSVAGGSKLNSVLILRHMAAPALVLPGRKLSTGGGGARSLFATGIA